MPDEQTPDIENHPVLRAAKTLISIHQEQIDLIQNDGKKFYKTDPETGAREDVTAQVLGEHASNVNKARELIERVRNEKVFTTPDLDTIRLLDLPISEKSYAEKVKEEAAGKLAQTVGDQSALEEAEHVAEDPLSAVHLPEDR